MLQVEITGFRSLERQLRDVEAEAKDLSNFIKETAVPLVRKEVKRLFDSGGYFQWPALAPSTVARKGHSRILIDTRRLIRSVTLESSADKVIEITDNSLVFGTNVPYARYHEEGTSRLPKRPVFELLGQHGRFLRRMEIALDKHFQSRIDATD